MPSKINKNKNIFSENNVILRNLQKPYFLKEALYNF